MGKHANPRVMITITPEIKEAIDFLAESEHRSAAQMGKLLILEALQARADSLPKEIRVSA